ncbi:MAG: hypothetical protein U1D55_00145 [Phycisphaerae bacterium]
MEAHIDSVSPSVSESELSSESGRDGHGRFAPGNTHGFLAGRSGNPGGRPRGASFAAALARHAVTPVGDREEMVKIARTIGLDPAEARNIDVVAALFYVVVSRALLRAASGSGRADDRLVGMLQVLLKALDPTEVRLSGPDGGPIPIAAAVASVQAALGMLPMGADGGGLTFTTDSDAIAISATDSAPAGELTGDVPTATTTVVGGATQTLHLDRPNEP